MSIDSTTHLLLQQEFPAEYIQTVPKAGRNLSYVSHARVTQRLNEVDPNWTWEPMGTTSEGNPAVIKNGNFVTLWGKMTVAGVTRIGVGTFDTSVSGASSHDVNKELVSDFIRNAAMRFGVGLHLWMNDTSVATSAPRATAAAPQQTSLGDRVQAAAGAPVAPVQQRADTGELLTEGQGKNLYRLWKHVLKWDRNQFFDQIELICGVRITDDRQLTKQQASALIRDLKLMAGEEVDDGPPAQAPPVDDDEGFGYSTEPF